MDKKYAQESLETVHTTVGELISVITEIALKAGKTEEEGYELASRAIESILRRSRTDLESILN